MTEVASVRLDIAENWFRIHAANTEGRPLSRRKFRRDQVVDFFAGLSRAVVGVAVSSCGSAVRNVVWNSVWRNLQSSPADRPCRRRE